jgi:hypothetical protein
MEHKFKVGDTVKIIKRKEDNRTGTEDYNKPNGDVGKIGYVKEIHGSDNSKKIVSQCGNRYYGWFDSDDIELYQETTTVEKYRSLPFPEDKDYVILSVIKDITPNLPFVNSGYNPNMPKGSITWTTKSNWINGISIHPEENRYHTNFPKEYFELVESQITENKPRVPKVGDYVITRRYSENYDGRVLQITKIDSGKYCYFKVFDAGYYRFDANFGIEHIDRYLDHYKNFISTQNCVVDTMSVSNDTFEWDIIVNSPVQGIKNQIVAQDESYKIEQSFDEPVMVKQFKNKRKIISV